MGSEEQVERAATKADLDIFMLCQCRVGDALTSKVSTLLLCSHCSRRSPSRFLHYISLYLCTESRGNLAREEDLPVQQPSTRCHLVVNFFLKHTSPRSQPSLLSRLGPSTRVSPWKETKQMGARQASWYKRRTRHRRIAGPVPKAPSITQHLPGKSPGPT